MVASSTALSVASTVARAVAGVASGGPSTPPDRPRGQTLWIAEGDSITNGALVAANNSYAGQVGARFLGRIGYQVTAFDGSTLANVVGRAATVDALITSRPLSTEQILSVMVGVNDGPSNSTFVADLAAYCDARRSAGWKVIVCTITPVGDAYAQEAWRTTTNNTIRTWVGVHADAICDFDLEPIVADQTNTANATYWNVDTVHPTLATHTLMSAVFEPVLLSLTRTRSQPTSYLAWNPSDKQASVTLTNSNYTAEGTTTSQDGVRSVTWRDGGKIYTEVLLTVAREQQISMSQPGYDLAAFGGQNGISLGIYYGGLISTGISSDNWTGMTINGGNGPPWRLMIATDFDLGYQWWGINGAWADGGDPGAGTDHNFSFPPNIGWYLSANFLSAGSLSTLPASSSDLAYSIPTGFTAW